MAAKTDQLFKWAGILGILYVVFNEASNAILNNIDIGRPSIQLGQVNLTGINITISVPVINNTPVSIPLDSLQATVNYGGQPLTQVYLNQQIQISANNSTELTFNAVLDYVQLSQSVVNIIDSQAWLQALTFKGHATSNGIIFPFEETFSVGV